MAAIYRFLASYEGLIYLLLLLGGIFVLRWLWRAWREWQVAVWGLEREFAQQRLTQSAAIGIILIVLALAELVIVSFVVPALPADVLLPTPTINPLALPTGTLPPDLLTAIAENPGLFTGAAEGCVIGRLTFTSPKPGERVSGIVDLSGSVDILNFGFYKYEVAPLGSDSWAAISAGRDPVRDGLLGRWDTTELAPGDYRLRLVVTDNTGQTLPACIITVQVTKE